jgi:superfamily II DNA helicase RecQ
MPFRHLTQYQVLLCTACEFCVVPSQVQTHLYHHHPTITAKQRQQIEQQVAETSGLAQTVDTVVFPSPEERPIPGIPLQNGCFQCTQCQWLSSTLKNMQKHCRQVHQWKSGKGKGGSLKNRQAPESSQMWTTGHYCQQLFKTPTWKKWSKVQPISQQVDLTSRATLQQAGEDLLQAMEKDMQQKKDERLVTLLSTRSQANPWMEHTGWDHHLFGFEKAQLKDSLYPIEAPKEGLSATETALQKACQATIKVLYQAMQVCHPSIVPWNALLFVNRRECGAGSNEKPFYSKHRQDTLRKYCTIWVKLLRYLWHSQQWEERPSYVLTTYQSKLFASIQDKAGLSTANLTPKEAREQKEKLYWAVGSFWGSMLAHTLSDNEFESGLVSGIAVLGLDTSTGGWADPSRFTPILSGIVTLSRALVVYLAWRTREHDIKQGLAQGLEPAQAQAQATQVFPQVQTMVQEFMCLTQFDGQPSPIARILHMRTFGLKISLTTKSAPRVAWRDGCNEVSIDQTSFTIGELRDMVHGLHETCRERLVTQLMFLQGEEQLPQLELKRLFDNPAELGEEWSFLQDVRNLDTLQQVRRDRWLWKRMLNEEKISSQLLQGDLDQVASHHDLIFNQVGVESYFRKVKQFKEELVVLCHLTAGAPARGPELFSVMHENGQDSRAQRGVFLDDGMVEMVIPYHKGFSFSQKVKIIHRYLPQEVGELVVFFLWLVEPFLRQLQQLIYGQTAFSSHLWEPEPERSDTLEPELDLDPTNTDSSEDESQDPAFTDIGEDERDLEDEGKQRGASQQSRAPQGRASQGRACQPETVQPLNVDGFWSTNRLKRVMKRECNSRIGVEFSPSQWRQVYPAIQRVHMQSSEATELLDQLYLAKSGSSQQTQSAHSRFTEDMVYGLSMTENPLTTFTQQRQFRKLSQMWHQFLHFPSASAYTSQGSTQLQETQDHSSATHWSRLKEVNLLAQLQQMTHPQAEFRGIQLQALQAIISRQPRVVLVMKTGGGKSLMYMLPAACSPVSLTVVVVPLHSLQADQARRCQQAGLRVAQWGDSKAVRIAQVVLVTPESAVTKAFGRFLQQKASAGLLDRVVIDECHSVLDSGHGWRPKLLQLSQLVEQRCQLVYLTATLPPTDEKAFFHCSGLDPANVLLFRDPTTRPNIAYQVVEYNAQDQDQVVQRIVQNQLQQTSSPGQVILYCKSVKQCQHIGQILGCPTYFREVGSLDEKQAILTQLLKQQIQVIAATNALGLGIDAPSIQTVIHLGVPSSIRDYAQESGRAGRDGRYSQAIILRSFQLVGQRKIVEKGWKLQASMADFLQGYQCRRISLDRTLDGRTNRTGCEEGEEKCDVCLQSESGKEAQELSTEEAEAASPSDRRVERGSKRQWSSTQEFQQQEGQLREMKRARRAATTTSIVDLNQLHTKFVTWSKVGCLVCWAQGQQEWTQQTSASWQSCQQHSSSASQQMEAVFEKVKALHCEKYSGCLFCWAPQAVCHLWEEKYITSGTRTTAFQRCQGGRCQYPKLVPQVVAAVVSQRMGDLTDREEWLWVQEEMQKIPGFWDASSEESKRWDLLWKWLGLKKVSNSIEMSCMVQMIYYLG